MKGNHLHVAVGGEMTQLRSVVIIGSGPAAAGAALALLEDPGVTITIIDLGLRLEEEHEAARRRLAQIDESSWRGEDLAVIQHQPVAIGNSRLPQKRTYGSDFPFRDLGQQQGLPEFKGHVDPVVSGAYGGFSNVWGAQTMPFSRATFDCWPLSYDDLAPHYKVALDEMHVSGDDDDLANLFPHIAPPIPLPPLSARTNAVLGNYERNRAALGLRGLTLGRARVALNSTACTRCGLCMTGCPNELIYSSSQTFDRLRATGRVNYRPGLMALKLAEDEQGPLVRVKSIESSMVEDLRADRIFVACGGLGSTRLVLGSLEETSHRLEFLESAQFLIPALSLHPVGDPEIDRDFTLNQFNMVYDDSGIGLDLVQVHFYPNNPAVERGFPSFVQSAAFAGLRSSTLKRLSVGLGYLPSWASPTATLTARATGINSLPDLELERKNPKIFPPMLRRFLSAMLKSGAQLDLWPVLPMVTLSDVTKSYHFGGTFPMSNERGGYRTDVLGRLDRWEKIHLIDGSVFPSIPATTFTLTVMANAHRIAKAVCRQEKTSK